jgi:hypothetical protein
MSVAHSPAAYGLAMLVPDQKSPRRIHRGTVDVDQPGVTISGLSSSPPRELNDVTAGAVSA